MSAKNIARAMYILFFAIFGIIILVAVISCGTDNTVEESTTCIEQTESDNCQETVPMNVYNFTDEEKYLIARVLWNEAGSNSDMLRDYCLSVMVNQLNDGRYGETITDVLSRKNGYVGYDFLNRANDADLTECYESIERICKNGSVLPKEVVFFSVGGFTWEGLETYAIVEGVYFQNFDAIHYANGWH